MSSATFPHSLAVPQEYIVKGSREGAAHEDGEE
jgi:hypothetical protein